MLYIERITDILTNYAMFFFVRLCCLCLSFGMLHIYFHLCKRKKFRLNFEFRASARERIVSHNQYDFNWLKPLSCYHDFVFLFSISFAFVQIMCRYMRNKREMMKKKLAQL